MPWNSGVDEFHAKELIINEFQERVDFVHTEFHRKLLHDTTSYHTQELSVRRAGRKGVTMSEAMSGSQMAYSGLVRSDKCK